MSTTLTAVIAAAQALLDGVADMTDADQLSDEQLEQLAGGSEIMRQLENWDDHHVLPTTPDALQRLGEIMLLSIQFNPRTSPRGPAVMTELDPSHRRWLRYFHRAAGRPPPDTFASFLRLTIETVCAALNIPVPPEAEPPPAPVPEIVVPIIIDAAAGANQGIRTDLPQNSAEPAQPIETRAELAKLGNLSHDTVSKVETAAPASAPPAEPPVVEPPSLAPGRHVIDNKVVIVPPARGGLRML